MQNTTNSIKLSDDKLSELRAQLDLYRHYAVGYHEGELGVRARHAWDYYYGKLPEPVQIGSSQWVDRSVFDAVNGTLQELISVFTSGEDAVRFSPMNSTDAHAARASTKMVNKILLRENDGYRVLHDAFKEALISRNGFVKRYWNKDVKIVEECFEEITQEDLDLYIASLEGEIVEMTVEEDVVDGELQNTFSGFIKYEVEKEGVKVEYTPFEQVIIEPTATTLRDANFVAHRVRKSKDELLDMGFDKSTVETLTPQTSDIEAGVIANARINNLSPINVNDVLAVGDNKADKVWLYENYIKTSLISGELEMYQVFTVHGQILEVNKVSDHPFETFTPLPIPGSIWGESVYDITKDIQDLNTSLIRGIIDNIMNANFRRYQAVKGAYDRQSLLSNRPGGVVEVQMIDAVQPFAHHQLPSGVMDLLEYVEAKKEQRTGVTRLGQGLDPNVFKNDNSTATVNTMLTMAQNRMRMIARNVAQTGMMQLMLSIYDLVRNNATKPIRVETARGEMVIDPRTLPKREEMIVAVAVGNNERRERAQSLNAALQMMSSTPQMQMFFQPENAYFMAQQIMESMGIYDTENFLTPMDQLPPQQPNPLEEMQKQAMVEQIKQLQATTQKILSEINETQRRSEFEQMKAADEFTIKREESMSKQDEAADRMSIEEMKVKLEAERVKIEREKMELKRQELMLEAQIEMAQGRAVGLGKA